MMRHAVIVLVVRAWIELLAFDLRALLRRRVDLDSLMQPPPSVRNADDAADELIVESVNHAACLYWKRVMCLQRSVCAVRLLRRCGVPARLVIGYRPCPFIAHAWVEIRGRVTPDARGYAARLRPFYVA
jgi:hypothetical protein